MTNQVRKFSTGGRAVDVLRGNFPAKANRAIAASSEKQMAALMKATRREKTMLPTMMTSK